VQDVEGLVDAGRRAAALLGAGDVSLMWVVDGCLELLSDNQDSPGERWELSRYPATMRLLETRTPGQIVVGDAFSDHAEVEELVRLGYGALLMVPIRVAGGLQALAEVYRVHPQAFTNAEVDRARVVVQQFAPVLARLASPAAA
jgi:hypothetical protein